MKKLWSGLGEISGEGQSARPADGGASSGCVGVASRRVLGPSGLRDAVVLFEGERIRGVVDRADVPSDALIDDVGSAVVMAGLVDGHVQCHCSGRSDSRRSAGQPGEGPGDKPGQSRRERWDAFGHATRAAAAGGVTTLGDMPAGFRPVTSTIEAFEAKRWATAGQLHVDVGFHGALAPGYQDQIDPLVAAGALTMKAFLADPGIGDLRPMSETDLESAMPVLARAGVPLTVHAELSANPRPSASDQDPRSYAAYRASRPSRFEVDAIELLIRLCRQTGCAVHVAHLATSYALGTLRSARGEGLPITVETCPHYLTFAAGEIADGDTRFKCAPPIRGAAHRDGLWRGLAEGTIDLVASDHSPAPAGLRLLRTGDFRRAWSGIASLQLLLPATFTAALSRGFGLLDVERWLCRRPARLLGLEGRKGSLEAGCDADLVVWNPESTFDVAGAELEHRHPETPYEGRTLFGVVERTYLRGRRIFDREQGIGSTTGQLLRRPAAVERGGDRP